MLTAGKDLRMLAMKENEIIKKAMSMKVNEIAKIYFQKFYATVSALIWRRLYDREPDERYRCPVCSYISEEMTNFCAHCGQKLEGDVNDKE